MKQWLPAIILLTCLAAGLPVKGQSEWKLRKEKDGIQVYFREAAGTNLKELKILTRFEAPLSAVVALLSDVEHFPSWMDHCRDVRKLKVNSPTDYVYYNLANFPWPLSDREFVMHCRGYQNPNTLAFTFHSEAVPDFIPSDKRYVRVQETISQWRLTPGPDGALQVEYYLKADPGGAIPAWMVNMALDSGPVKAIKNLQALLQTEEYQTLRLAYVQEPGK